MAVSVAIRMTEKMTAPINNIINATNSMINEMERVSRTGENAFDASAVEDMRVSIEAAQAEMSELAGESENVGDEIRENTSAQEKFNGKTSGLLGILGRIAAAYLSLGGLKKVLDLSDELTTNRARLDMMNDGLQTTDELTRMVRRAAHNARGGYASMANVVARFGNNAGEAFADTAEVVRFSELVQKQMTIAGASPAESSNAMLQLSQALGSGVLRGDELNSIFEQAPNLIRTIADYLGVSIGQIREMASEGEITAGIVKNAILSSADDINEQFDNMPITWGQRVQSFKNEALTAFEPLLIKVNELANSERAQEFFDRSVDLLYRFADTAVYVCDTAGNAANFVIDNWDKISPVLAGVITVMAAYRTQTFLLTVANGALTMSVGTAATAFKTMAAAMLANPVTWLLLALGALGVGFVVLSNKVGGTRNAILILKDFFKTGIEDIMLFFHGGYVEIANTCDEWAQVFNTLGVQMGVAMGSAKISVLRHLKEMVEKSADLINRLITSVNSMFNLSIPTIDAVSGFAIAGIDKMIAEQERENAEKLAGNKTYLAQKQAAIQARNDIYAQTKAAVEADRAARSNEIINSMAESFADGFDLKNPMEDYAGGLEVPIAAMAENTAGIADTTKDISDKVDMTDEDLRFLRDMAEREAVNRFTTAEVRVEFGGVTNNLSSDMDIDGFINVFTDRVEEAMLSAAEGVHT